MFFLWVTYPKLPFLQAKSKYYIVKLLFSLYSEWFSIIFMNGNTIALLEQKKIPDIESYRELYYTEDTRISINVN